MPVTPAQAASERVVSTLSGWMMLFVNFALLIGAAFVASRAAEVGGPIQVLGGLLALAGIFMLGGYFTLQPNQARVLILFGAYKGTVRVSGFHWANPLYSRTRGTASPKEDSSQEGSHRNRSMGRRGGALGFQWLTTKLSLRARNFSSDALKVNDKRGNPVEIAAVVVWRVENTAQAVFDVEDYTSYVEIQSESAIRSIASRRQQAEAIIAARKIIVQNAVGMVHMALDELDQKNVVKLDDERKAAMVSNLLVVLCGNSDASPVINTGTLYT